MKPMPWTAEPKGDFKRRWNHWIHYRMLNKKESLNAEQARYKKFDRSLRSQKETITENDDVFLRVERKNNKENRHKLAPIADGTLKVVKDSHRIAVIERPDRSVELLSRTCLVLSLKAMSKKEVNDLLKLYKNDIK